MGAPRSSIYGVGVNDADYCVYKSVGGKVIACKYYVKWKDMLKRAYSKKHKEDFPTYKNTTACNEWHSFMAFREWMIQQDWIGKQLDKDLLIQGNKIYSPLSCVFVPNYLNNIFLDSGKIRGNWPIGVHFDKDCGKYQSHLRTNRKRVILGRFESPLQAHAAWQKAKADYVENVAIDQKDSRLKAALMLRVNQLRNDLANNRETFDL